MAIKIFKALWQVFLIASEIWKVLERNYKKWIENKNSTGRGRKTFKFSDDLEEIYGKKKNVYPIHPVMVLSTETQDVNLTSIDNQEISESTSEQRIVPQDENRGEVVRKKRLKKRKTILEVIRENRLNYQKEKLKILKSPQEEIVKLLSEKNEIAKERNEILQEKK
ncbi:hypothetical protein ABEB36_014194 [Hypothenemus hampei]|uniref:Uncharacterized protein n=1 Tax=Hypothenemus hampei TaxID=57062 RepID=A0ABD1E3J9_HYPHA